MINGIHFDFSSIEIYLDGHRYAGVKDINYSDSLEGSKVYGTGAKPIGQTRGQHSCEASLTMYRDDFYSFQSKLGPGYGEREFGITVAYAEAGRSTNIDQLITCRIKKVDTSHATGGDALEVKIDLSVMDIKRSGHSLTIR